jgi:hypothetical protein
MALADNLIAYWPLDEASGDALDAHGSLDLTETGGTIGTATGKVGDARDFEADDTEFFARADGTDLSTGDIDFTFAAWVQLESKPSSATLISKGTVSDGEYYLMYRGGGTDRFEFSAYGGAGFASGSTARADNLGSPSSATWYFVVAWHDSVNNQIGIAVNAGTADTASHSAGVLDGSGAFFLGAGYPHHPATGGEPWDGLIDEVGFWKRVLTGSERTELYNAGAGRDYAYIAGGGGGGGNRRRRLLLAAGG